MLHQTNNLVFKLVVYPNLILTLKQLYAEKKYTINVLKQYFAAYLFVDGDVTWIFDQSARNFY